MQLQALANSDDVEALRRAAALYGGYLLDGLEVHSPAFEDWLRDERQRYRELAAEILKKLLRCETGAGKATVAHRLLTLDPCRRKATEQ
jgi:DNA-binding SARP family transcriptional activator